MNEENNSKFWEDCKKSAKDVQEGSAWKRAGIKLNPEVYETYSIEKKNMTDSVLQKNICHLINLDRISKNIEDDQALAAKDCLKLLMEDALVINENQRKYLELLKKGIVHYSESEIINNKIGIHHILMFFGKEFTIDNDFDLQYDSYEKKFEVIVSHNLNPYCGLDQFIFFFDQIYNIKIIKEIVVSLFSLKEERIKLSLEREKRKTEQEKSILNKIKDMFTNPKF